MDTIKELKFLPIEKKLQLIHQLEKMDLSDCTHEFLLDFLNPIFKGYTVNALSFETNLVLYRGIKYNDRPKVYKELIYPPKHRAKTNRASYEGEQMFYCSTLKKAPFYELSLVKGDKIVLSTWINQKPLMCNNVGYTESNFITLGASREIPVAPIELKEINIKDNRIIAEFLGKTFCKKITDDDKLYYKLTNAIAKLHIKDNFHGLLYPTIQYSANSDNIALTKETIDKNFLQLKQVEFAEILDIKENRYCYKILDFAEEISGDLINWKNLDKTWTVFDDSEEIYFTDEFGSFEGYNSDGDMVHPDQ